MATIRKRTYKSGAVGWVLDYFDPDGKRVRKSFKLKKDAMAERDRVGVDITEGTYRDPRVFQKHTFGRLCERYEENFRHQKSFAIAKTTFIKNFRAHFGENRRLVSFRYYDMEHYRNLLIRKPVLNMNTGEVKGKRKESSINSEISCLRHMFKKAVEWEMLRESPFSNGGSLVMKVNNKRERYLTPDEYDRLVAAAPPHLRHILEFAVHTGARRKEVLNLKWRDIQGSHVRFGDTKTDESRQVPLNSKVMSLLVLLGADGREPDRRVFRFKGRSMSMFHDGLRAACESAGIPYGRETPHGVTFHTLRHTFASWLAIKGVPMRTLQELLGHKTITMTMRYSHLSEQTKQNAVELLAGDPDGDFTGTFRHVGPILEISGKGVKLQDIEFNTEYPI